MNSVLIIEDDANIRESLAYNLKTAGLDVSSAADGHEGLEKALTEKPDLILLDIMLPEMDGLAVCERIRRLDENVRVIMITALGTDSDKIRGLTIGADDYVTKPFNFDELLARVRAQLRRAPAGGKGRTKVAFGDVRLDGVKHEVTVGEEPVQLRPKEFKLLFTLAANPGVLFSRAQLGTLIWGNEFVGASRTIDVHIQRLREKVEKVSAYTFLRTVHGLGYRFELEPARNADEA